MDINKFIAYFADQFDETDISEINADTEFHELDEWSSLVALAVLNMIDKKYGKKVTFDDMKNSVTVSDLFKIIESK